MDDKDSILMQRAISSENLKERADGNRLYGINDFNLWSRQLFKGTNFSSVLDICCGTGNQLVLYAQMPNIARIVGVDISKESLQTASERIKETGTTAEVVLKAIKMEEAFSDAELKTASFDLISCFYGLYYCQSLAKIISEMVEHLAENGTIIIVGPHGDNNAELFALLGRHFKLPELVLRSSSTFMEAEVLPILRNYCEVKSEYFVNQVHYPDAKALLDYWRSSTFYSSAHEQEVARDIEAHFSSHKDFIIKKNVVAFKSKRKR